MTAPAGLTPALRLIVILDTAAAAGRDLTLLATAAVAGGATMLQVRAKSGTAAVLAGLTRAVLDVAGAVPVVVNDRLDVALATGAAGCHLGQDDLPIGDALRQAPPGFIVGGSAGTVAEARRAVAGGAHYLGVGPLRDTAHKGDAGTAIGLSGFREVCAAGAGVPCVAIGGVTAADAAAVLGAGGVGVAVIGAVLLARDPRLAARALRVALEGGAP